MKRLAGRVALTMAVALMAGQAAAADLEQIYREALAYDAALAAALQARAGGPELVARYGREWRVSPAFDLWVRSDGPRRAAAVLGQLERAH